MRIRIAVFLGLVASVPQDVIGQAHEVQPVPQIAMEGMEPAVREQIETQRNRLASLAQAASVAGPQLGQAYGELGQLYLLYDLSEPAVVALGNATVLDAKQPRWPYLLGSLHELEGRFEAARAAYRDALERSGTGPPSLPIVARLVRVLLPDAATDAEVVDDIDTLLVRLERPDAAAYQPYSAFARGELAFAQQLHTQAAEWYSRALAAQPGANQLHYRLALAHREAGDLDRARFHLENRGDREITFPDPVVADLRSQAKGAGAQLMLGRIALSTGDLDEAEQRFRAALDIAPENAAALQSLGNLHRRRGEENQALDAYERALQATPDDVRLRLFVARLLLARSQETEQAPRLDRDQLDQPATPNDLERGLLHLEEAALLAPNQVAVQVEWAEALQRAFRFADAERVYQRAVDRAPAEFDLHYLRAQNASQEIAHLGTRNQLTGEVLETLGARGRASLQSFRVGLEASGKSLAPEIEAELGLLELRLGDSETGRGRLRKLLDAADVGDPARALAAFHLGNEAVQRSALDEAIEYLTRAVALQPGLREARMNLARLHEGRGDLDEAAIQYGALLDAESEDLAARFALAENRLRAGRYGDAKSLLLEGLELAPGTPAFAQLLVRIVVAAPDESVRDGALGLDLAQRLWNALPTTDHAESLAMALAELGQFADAAQWQSRVLEELQSQGRPTAIAEERLQAYRNEQRIWGWGPGAPAENGQRSTSTEPP